MGRDGGSFMLWIWDLIVYSFLGFLLEAAFAWATGGRTDRKGLLVLPLCPVYGAGACLILALPGWVDERPWALFLLGGMITTALEVFFILSAVWLARRLFYLRKI